MLVQNAIASTVLTRLGYLQFISPDIKKSLDKNKIQMSNGEMSTYYEKSIKRGLHITSI